MKSEYVPANRIKYYLSHKKRTILRENNLKYIDFPLLPIII